MSAKMYAVLLTVPRWRFYPAWLPFGRVELCFEKQTTWDEAYDVAMGAAGRGAENVRIVGSERERAG